MHSLSQEMRRTNRRSSPVLPDRDRTTLHEVASWNAGSIHVLMRTLALEPDGKPYPKRNGSSIAFNASACSVLHWAPLLWSMRARYHDLRTGPVAEPIGFPSWQSARRSRGCRDPSADCQLGNPSMRRPPSVKQSIWICRGVFACRSPRGDRATKSALLPYALY